VLSIGLVVHTSLRWNLGSWIEVHCAELETVWKDLANLHGVDEVHIGVRTSGRCAIRVEQLARLAEALLVSVPQVVKRTAVRASSVSRMIQRMSYIYE
jgi:hypothetical protein